MPSKEDICVVQETLPSSKKDFLTADVEELVSALKHNLQLKSKPQYRLCRKHMRMSPYSAPVRTSRRSAVDKENSMEHSKYNCRYCVYSYISRSPKSDCEDPYENLQNFIRTGSLIKEAVKRLQYDLQNNIQYMPKKYKYELDTESESEIIGVEI